MEPTNGTIEDFIKIALCCAPPKGLVPSFAHLYGKPSIESQYQFMQGVFKICTNTFHQRQSKGLAIKNWGQLNDLFIDVMYSYEKIRNENSTDRNVKVRLLPAAITRFSFNTQRGTGNFLATLNLYDRSPARISVRDFIDRCKKYFGIEIPTENLQPDQLKSVIAESTITAGAALHSLAFINSEAYKELMNFLLPIIYDENESRDKRLNGVFALAFLYGSCPHCIQSDGAFIGGAFAADFFLQYLLFSIGEKCIQKNYLTLTEIELLLLFSQDTQEAWSLPLKYYDEACEGKSNLLFHQGDTSSLNDVIQDHNETVSKVIKKHGVATQISSIVKVFADSLITASKSTANIDLLHAKLQKLLTENKAGNEDISLFLSYLEKHKPITLEEYLVLIRLFLGKDEFETQHDSFLRCLLDQSIFNEIGNSYVEIIPANYIKSILEYINDTKQMPNENESKSYLMNLLDFALRKIAQYEPAQLKEFISITQHNDLYKNLVKALLSRSADNELSTLMIISLYAPDHLETFISQYDIDTKAVQQNIAIPSNRNKVELGALLETLIKKDTGSISSIIEACRNNETANANLKKTLIMLLKLRFNDNLPVLYHLITDDERALAKLIDYSASDSEIRNILKEQLLLSVRNDSTLLQFFVKNNLVQLVRLINLDKNESGLLKQKNVAICKNKHDLLADVFETLKEKDEKGFSALVDAIKNNNISLFTTQIKLIINENKLDEFKDDILFALSKIYTDNRKGCQILNEQEPDLLDMLMLQNDELHGKVGNLLDSSQDDVLMRSQSPADTVIISSGCYTDDDVDDVDDLPSDKIEDQSPETPKKRTGFFSEVNNQPKTDDDSVMRENEAKEKIKPGL